VGLDRAASLSEPAGETVELVTTPPIERIDILICLLSSRRRGRYDTLYGSGHSSFAWKIRSYNVKTVFSSLHETSDLISSLDGIVMWRAGREHAQMRDGSIWIKTRFSNLVKVYSGTCQPHGFYSSDGR
jgi:hypothetical protein